jgi:hypothetical protein
MEIERTHPDISEDSLCVVWTGSDVTIETQHPYLTLTLT